MGTDKYTGKDLIAMGFKPSHHFKLLLQKANEYRDLYSRDVIIELLKQSIPNEPEKLVMRKDPIVWSKFIEPTSEEEIANLVGVEKQMDALLKCPVVEAGAIMPDSCPAGMQEAMIPVGGIIRTKNAIIPSAHSADICCSMYATFYESDISIKDELDVLTSVTRFGVGGRKESDWVEHPVIDEDIWENTFLKGLKVFAQKHMADQGDGNHFAYIGETTFDEYSIIELEKAEHVVNLKTGVKYRVLVTHHGSRGLGAQLYKRGQKLAIMNTSKIAKDIPNSAAWIDMKTEEGGEYWDALQYIARWTEANHYSIHKRFFTDLLIEPVWHVHNQHNFVWRDGEDYYHGKGATPAGKNVLGIIPLNMGAPILLVLGAGNEDALSFAPHGAGRNLSRTALKNKIGDEAAQAQEIVDSTSHIDVRWYSGKPDVSETPCAYKDADSIIAQIERFNLASVVTRIEPLGCIMAGEGPPPLWAKKKS